MKRLLCFHEGNYLRKSFCKSRAVLWYSPAKSKENKTAEQIENSSLLENLLSYLLAIARSVIQSLKIWGLFDSYMTMPKDLKGRSLSLKTLATGLLEIIHTE